MAGLRKSEVPKDGYSCGSVSSERLLSPGSIMSKAEKQKFDEDPSLNFFPIIALFLSFYYRNRYRFVVYEEFLWLFSFSDKCVSIKFILESHYASVILFIQITRCT